jgi:transcriptional regulator with XRE-family HTH domain
MSEGTEAEIFDVRALTPQELALMVSAQRQGRGWTQTTLAEVSGLTERTIQRVEGGEPSSLDTRRALARAFEWEDIDIFSKPWPIRNAERLQKEKECFERETVPVSIVRFTGGRQARELADQTQALAFSTLAELCASGQTIWASFEDYIKDYDLAHDCCSAADKLQVNEALQHMLDDLAGLGIAVGGGTRRVKVNFPLASPEAPPLPLIVGYFVACPERAFPTSIRVPRSGPIQ